MIARRCVCGTQKKDFKWKEIKNEWEKASTRVLVLEAILDKLLQETLPKKPQKQVVQEQAKKDAQFKASKSWNALDKNAMKYTLRAEPTNTQKSIINQPMKW